VPVNYSRLLEDEGEHEQEHEQGSSITLAV